MIALRPTHNPGKIVLEAQDGGRVTIKDPVGPIPAELMPVLRGPKGDKGDPGDGTATFEFVFSSPSAEWVVSHGLGRNPSVTLLDSFNERFDAQVIYTNLNTITIRLGAPDSGKVYLN